MLTGSFSSGSMNPGTAALAKIPGRATTEAIGYFVDWSCLSGGKEV